VVLAFSADCAGSAGAVPLLRLMQDLYATGRFAILGVEPAHRERPAASKSAARPHLPPWLDDPARTRPRTDRVRLNVRGWPTTYVAGTRVGGPVREPPRRGPAEGRAPVARGTHGRRLGCCRAFPLTATPPPVPRGGIRPPRRPATQRDAPPPKTGPAAWCWPRSPDASAGGQLNGELHVDATCVIFVAVSLGRSDSLRVRRRAAQAGPSFPPCRRSRFSQHLNNEVKVDGKAEMKEPALRSPSAKRRNESDCQADGNEDHACRVDVQLAVELTARRWRQVNGPAPAAGPRFGRPRVALCCSGRRANPAAGTGGGVAVSGNARSIRARPCVPRATGARPSAGPRLGGSRTGPRHARPAHTSSATPARSRRTRSVRGRVRRRGRQPGAVGEAVLRFEAAGASRVLASTPRMANGQLA